MKTLSRKTVAAIMLSASALIGLVSQEGFTTKAVIPVEGDVPTLGFGTTTHENGVPVKLGDTITPQAALSRVMTDIQQFEGALRQCVTVPLSQHEYDAFVMFSYNVGAAAFCSSTLVKKLNAGDYPGACRELLRWTYVAGRDCRDRANKCYGLVTRRQHEYSLCMGEL